MFFLMLVYLIRKKSRILLFLWILFGVLSTEAVADFLIYRLEKQYPPVADQEAKKVDAIILLGGFSDPLKRRTEMPEFGEGVDRILAAERLWELKKADFIIISGATGYIRQSVKPEAQSAFTYLSRRIPDDALIIESGSRNTLENAKESLKICREKNVRSVYVITSAFHMPRTMETFQDVRKKYYPEYEIEILPFPVDYRSKREIAGVEDVFPSHLGLEKITIFYKELIGLIAYKLKNL